MTDMPWSLSWRADPVGRDVADRHYNRQSVGAQDFVPPGRCLVLTAPGALWVTSWPLPEFTKHAWAGAWVNSTFRRESGDALASDLIRAAVAATRWKWPTIPALGIVSFVDPTKVRHKRDPGRCYRHAGFRLVGRTKGGLLAWQLLPADMPDPLRLPHRRRRHSVTVAPSWDLLLGWAVDAYWERHGNHDRAA